MIEFELQQTYNKGFSDASNGYVNIDLVFNGTKEHDDYVLGFKAGIVEKLTNARKTRKPKAQPQVEMFGGFEAC